MPAYDIVDILREKGLKTLTEWQAAQLFAYQKMRTEVIHEQMEAAKLAEENSLEASTFRTNIFNLSQELKSIEKILRELPIEKSITHSRRGA